MLSSPTGLTNLWSGKKKKRWKKTQSKRSAGYRGFWQMIEKNQVNNWGGGITGIRNRCVWLHRCITARMGTVVTEGGWWHEQALRITSKQNKLSAKQVKTKITTAKQQNVLKHKINSLNNVNFPTTPLCGLFWQEMKNSCVERHFGTSNNYGGGCEMRRVCFSIRDRGGRPLWLDNRGCGIVWGT